MPWAAGRGGADAAGVGGVAGGPSADTGRTPALGSAPATIGPTIPAMAAVSLLIGFGLVLGPEAKGAVPAVPTLSAGRTTVPQGGVHPWVSAVFLFPAMTP